MNTETIKIKYHTDEIEKLRYIDGKSDWIDLRSAEDVELKAGEFKLISLGVSMELPKGYEAHIVPRSSTFKNFGVIQTNHQAVIDEYVFFNRKDAVDVATNAEENNKKVISTETYYEEY